MLLMKRAEDAEELSEVEREWRESITGLETVDEMVEIGSRQVVASKYAHLLHQLNLDAETFLYAGDIIRLAYTDMSMQGLEFLAGQQPEMLNDADYARWMSEELRHVLSPRDLAVFDEYHASLPGGMLGQQMEMELASFRSELTEQSRNSIRDVLVAEMRSGSWLASYDGEDPGALMEGLYRRAGATLVNYLDSEQLAIYNRYTEQQLLGIRLALGMME